MKAIVLLSGGLDSATALGMALAAKREVMAVSFNYKQRHAKELLSATMLAHYYEVEHRIVTIGGLDYWSALTSPNMDVPTGRDEERMAKDIPVTYVPARNSVFLAIAMGFAESFGADEVWTGFNAVDYSGYPDCRLEYVQAMQAALALGTKRGVDGNPIRIETPIIDMTKVQIVESAIHLGVPMQLTWSCYKGQDKPCGECDSCVIRTNAFKAVGMEDPAR
jgi:7-cyano-7-deazaguanine synthase